MGFWGVEQCSLDAAFVSATIRHRRGNRSQHDHMAVPIGTVARLVTFGGFKRLLASFRVASVALRDIPTCPDNLQLSFV